jgi:RimJ/RimL family protein N-acetyltransferase
MLEENLRRSWERPGATTFEGQHVLVSRLNPTADLDDLYSVSHGSPEIEALWTYLPYGPFADQGAMRQWLTSIELSEDPRFYSVTSRSLQKRVGMVSIMNIVPEMGRAELGHIWYSPLVQKSAVNTEVTFLLLRYLFDDIGYRRVEWKCDNRNEASKNAALRLGFQYEGLFRQHMVVKRQNRDTAWFAIVDKDWPAIRSNFEAYLSTPGLSLKQLNRETRETR